MKRLGFTLIELLVVISIIALLGTLAFMALNTARQKSRDVKRLADMRQQQTALAMYYDKLRQYPNSDNQGCGSWDTPGNGTFIHDLVIQGFLATDAKDPVSDDSCGNYRYYRYSSGSYGCDSNSGAYYVLGVVNMESSSGAYSSSPGWSCSGRNWQNEMEWVTGSFEN